MCNCRTINEKTELLTDDGVGLELRSAVFCVSSVQMNELYEPIRWQNP